MAARSGLSSLVDYGSSDEEEANQDVNPSGEGSSSNETAPFSSGIDLSKYQVVAAPHIDESLAAIKQSRASELLDERVSEVNYNPKYDELYAPVIGPSNPFSSDSDRVPKNTLTGYVEPAHVSESIFETERRKFHCVGVASNPSDSAASNDQVMRGLDGSTERRPSALNQPKRRRNNDPSDIDNYSGLAWGQFENEEEVKIAKPSEEDAAQIAEFMAKKKKHSKKPEQVPVEEKATLHIPDPYDYQGRSFLHPSHDLDVNLKPDHVPNKCFLPKRVIHTYTGHTKAVTCIKWFPRTAHIFLSASMDSKIKLWEVYKGRRCIQTYSGHKQAVRDISFSRNGDKFVSAGYDRSLKIWDTETGQCVKRLSSKKVAYSVKFNPEEERQHLILTGMSDKKILCWDTRSGQIVQEYDRHLGAINTITFVDNNRRFITTSDDKSIRVWEWDIPVDVKYIADPTLHAIPAVSPSPSGKWLLMQSMDNKIQAFICMNRFKLTSKKVFTGHMVAGYACVPDFSPDMSFVISGDADGKVFIWDWKTSKLLTNFQAHDNVCIASLWHPHETSKVLTAGWDNVIKLWD